MGLPDHRERKSDEFKSVSDGARDESDGVKSVSDGARDGSDGVKSVSDGARDASDGVRSLLFHAMSPIFLTFNPGFLSAGLSRSDCFNGDYRKNDRFVKIWFFPESFFLPGNIV